MQLSFDPSESRLSVVSMTVEPVVQKEVLVVCLLEDLPVMRLSGKSDCSGILALALADGFCVVSAAILLG